MKPTFAHACFVRLLYLYPQTWRERYAEEVAAVLEERPASFRTLFDLFLSIVDAYFHRDLFTERNVLLVQRLRSSQIMIYWCAILFSCLLLLYTSESVMFWDPGLTNQHNYHLILLFVDFGSLVLLLTTFLGSLVFIAGFFKHTVTSPPRTSFFIWSLTSAMSVTALSYALSQAAVPVGSSYTLAKLLTQLSYLGSLLTLFGNEVCLALVFVGLQQILKKKTENRLPSLVVWGVGVCVPLMLIVINYRTTVNLSTAPLQNSTLLISLIVFGSLFLKSQSKRKTAPSVRLTYSQFLPLVLMTLFMNTLLLIPFLQTVELHIHNSHLVLLRYSVLNGILLFMAFLALLASLFLWRGFRAQQGVTQ